MTVHILKCESKFYSEVAEGRKTFEIRKNDRPQGFQLGDRLKLKEIIVCDAEGCIVETGFTMVTPPITSIVTHEQFPNGLQPGYCILGWVK